jgi:hypothetical protein
LAQDNNNNSKPRRWDKGEKTGKRRDGIATFQTVMVILVLTLLAFSLYSAFEISSLQGQITSLQNQEFQQQQFMQQEFGYLASRIDSLAATHSSASSGASFVLASACISVTPDCRGTSLQGYVYFLTVDDNGSTTVPQGFSVGLSIKDATRLTGFGFNATLPGSLSPGSSVTLNASSWPSYTNATTKMSPGDEIGLSVSIGNFEVAIPAHVLSCTNTTTTFLNYTQSQTATLRNCQ